MNGKRFGGMTMATLIAFSLAGCGRDEPGTASLRMQAEANADSSAAAEDLGPGVTVDTQKITSDEAKIYLLTDTTG